MSNEQFIARILNCMRRLTMIDDKTTHMDIYIAWWRKNKILVVEIDVYKFIQLCDLFESHMLSTVSYYFSGAEIVFPLLPGCREADSRQQTAIRQPSDGYQTAIRQYCLLSDHGKTFAVIRQLGVPYCCNVLKP